MKITDHLFLIKNKIFKKDNIIIIIILTLMLITIYAGITVINFVTFFRNNMLDSPIGRTLLTTFPETDEEFQKLSNINHVQMFDSNKYLYGVPALVPQFDQDEAIGNIEIRPLLIDTDVNIVSGTNLKLSGSIICPLNFYPHSIYDTFDKPFYHSYVIDGKELIGEKINLEANEVEHPFNITGTFSNNVLDELNICYISKIDFDKFKNNIEYCSDDECYEYNSLMIRVDDYKNIDYVEESLTNFGYSPIRVLMIDEEILTTITYIPYLICSVILIISIAIIYNFIKKKSKQDEYRYGVLKSVGYENKNIKTLAIYEGLIIYFISLIVSTIIYLMIYLVFTKYSFSEINFYYLVVPIPWFYLFLFTGVFLVFLILIIRYLTKKSLSLSIHKLFESK